MKREAHRWHSPNLGHEMELILYGHGGQPLVAFPSQDGRFWDWEGFGLVESVGDYLEDGRLLLATVDSVDTESWTNNWLAPEDRARRHEAYERYIVDEVVPLLRERSGHVLAWTAGCSMGAFHAANTFFRRPDVLDGLIGISGVYSTRIFVGDAPGDEVYFNNPLAYLPGLDDPWFLERFRRSSLVFVAGQGAYEDEALADMHVLQDILAAKRVPATFDYWGPEAEHHWHWWARMLRHHLGVLLTAHGG
jgi:esterase/lipase superfamily enzyme